MLRHFLLLTIAGLMGLSGCADSAAPTASNPTASNPTVGKQTTGTSPTGAVGEVDKSASGTAPAPRGTSTANSGSGSGSTPAVKTDPVADATPSKQDSDQGLKGAEQAAPGPPAEDPLEAAQLLLNQGKLDEAIELLGQAAGTEGVNTRVFLAAANLNQAKGMQLAQSGDQAAYDWFKKAAGHARQFLAVEKDAPEGIKAMFGGVFYNEACAFSVGGDQAKAKSSLKEALDLGFADFDTIKSDADLAALREDSEVAGLIAAAEKVHLEREAAATQQLLAEFKPFEFTFSLPDLEGKTISLADLKGQVVIADIWGTWCPPCRAEIPHFVALQEKYQEAGLRIVGINYENGEPADAPKLIADFAKENKMNYPCVIGDEKTQAQVPNFEGFPTTLFIDRAGKVRLSVVGLQSHARLEAVVSMLLAEAAPETR